MHLFSLWEEINNTERDGLINRCGRPSVGEVGLKAGCNEGQPFSPGWWHEPGLKVTLWSRFMPPTGTNSGGPGARTIGPGSSHQPGPKGPDEPGPMAHVARPAPWAHEPGQIAPLVPVLDWTGTNGLNWPGRKPCFLLVHIWSPRQQKKPHCNNARGS